MTIGIYQSFYNDSHIPYLDNEFIPYDNRANPYPNLCEYAVNVQCYDLAMAAKHKVWGMFSWKWRQKIPALTPQHVLTFIEQNPDTDVYLFNPYPDVNTRHFNMWEQGNDCSPHMMEIAVELFPMLGLDVNLLYTPMPWNLSCFCSSFVGNQKFWDGWNALIKRYFEGFLTLSNRVQQLHAQSANYGPNADYNYFTFIHERLLSSYLQANADKFSIKQCDVGPYSLSSEYKLLRDMRETAIIAKDAELLHQWNVRRTPLATPAAWVEDAITNFTTTRC